MGGKGGPVKTYMEKLAAEPVTLAPANEEMLKALKKNDSGKVSTR